MCFLNSPVSNMELGVSFSQKRLDITDQSHSGHSRKNNPGPVDSGAVMIVLGRKEVCLGLVSNG